MNQIEELSERLIRTTVSVIGTHISDIINQDGDDKTDGEIIDEIVYYLKRMNIYKPRK